MELLGGQISCLGPSAVSGQVQNGSQMSLVLKFVFFLLTWGSKGVIPAPAAFVSTGKLVEK